MSISPKLQCESLSWVAGTILYSEMWPAVRKGLRLLVGISAKKEEYGNKTVWTNVHNKRTQTVICIHLAIRQRVTQCPSCPLLALQYCRRRDEAASLVLRQA